MAVKKKITKKKSAKKVAKKTPEKEEPKSSGRPKAIIDWGRVNELSHAQCTGTQIADIMGIHPDTLYRACEREHKVGFAAYSTQKKDSGVALIKESHFNQGKGGNISAQIFFLKNHDGQADKPVPESSSQKGTIMKTLDQLMEIKKK